jgi:phosphoglycerate dehydrogenase-like enzyme
MRGGGWERGRLGRQLGDLQVGIIGLGNVGSTVARRLSGFGSRVVYHDPVPRDFPGARPVALDRLLAESDVVCVHTPLDVDTHALINADTLATMKKGAILINAARGPIVDEPALVEALRSGHLGGAGLDVFETEPLPADSPLRSLDNVFLSPHVGGNTYEAESFLLEVVGANLIRVLDGEEPLNVVNGVVREVAR